MGADAAPICLRIQLPSWCCNRRSTSSAAQGLNGSDAVCPALTAPRRLLFFFWKRLSFNQAPSHPFHALALVFAARALTQACTCCGVCREE